MSSYPSYNFVEVDIVADLVEGKVSCMGARAYKYRAIVSKT